MFASGARTTNEQEEEEGGRQGRGQDGGKTDERHGKY